MRVAILEEDEKQAADIVNILARISFGENQIHSQSFPSGASLRSALRQETYDLLILSWITPDMSGIELLQWLRQFQKNEMPVIMLSSLDSEIDFVKALEKGADDYLVKPLRPLEFCARVVRLVQRRQGAAHSPRLVFGDWTFDRSTNSATVVRDDSGRRQQVHIELTEREFRLALALFQHLGMPLSRAHLLEYSGASGDELKSRALDSHMYRLRGKLFREGDFGLRLRTVYGQGYRLETMASARATNPAGLAPRIQ